MKTCLISIIDRINGADGVSQFVKFLNYTLGQRSRDHQVFAHGRSISQIFQIARKILELKKGGGVIIISFHNHWSFIDIILMMILRLGALTNGSIIHARLYAHGMLISDCFESTIRGKLKKNLAIFLCFLRINVLRIQCTTITSFEFRQCIVSRRVLRGNLDAFLEFVRTEVGSAFTRGPRTQQLPIGPKSVRPRFGFFGGSRHHKNYELVLKCFRGSERPRLDLYGFDVSPSGHVRQNCAFFPFLEGNRRFEVMAEYDCIIIPSVSENLSWLLLECIVLGVDVIITDKSPASEFMSLVVESQSSIITCNNLFLDLAIDKYVNDFKSTCSRS